MKRLILFLVFAVVVFAQRGGHSSAPSGGHFNNAPSQHFSQQRAQPHYSQQAQGWVRFGHPTYGYGRPMRIPAVIVRPGYGGYYRGWNYYFGMGFWPYYYPYGYYDSSVEPYQAQPCK